MFDQVFIPVTGRICILMVHHYTDWVQIYILLELIFSYRNTVESQFHEPPRETKIGFKNQRVREIGGKITVFD